VRYTALAGSVQGFLEGLGPGNPRSGDRDGTAGSAANRGFNGLKFSDLTDLAPRSIISDGGADV
jgi:hypothetical protein